MCDKQAQYRGDGGGKDGLDAGAIANIVISSATLLLVIAAFVFRGIKKHKTVSTVVPAAPQSVSDAWRDR